MLKQRNIIALTLLLGTSTLSQQSHSVQAVKLSKDSKTKAKKKAADDDEGPTVETNASHPPKEVSHFKQDMVAKWKKRAWWRDNAIPTEPSYNEGDQEAYTHPMGSTFVQKDSKWTDGNGAGSEKVDYWWHLDHHQNDPGADYKFNPAAAKPYDGELKSWNHADAEPTSHPNGFTAAGQIKKPKQQQASLAQWWTHGNGQGSEKWDGIEEAARFVNSEDAFHAKVNLQGNFIPNKNENDAEPTSHSNGFTAAAQLDSDQSWWTHGNGQGSEKWDGIEEAARFVNSQDAFHAKVNLQGNFIPNKNENDAEPTAHSNGFTAAAQTDTSSSWWTHGNGQGSEKWDATEEAARFANSDEEFHKQMKNGNMIPNLNGGDAEPTEHPMGFTSNAQVPEPIGAKMNNLNQKEAKWWTHGNGQGSEKWDGFEEAARFSNSQEEFHGKVKLQGNFIPSVNNGDSEPTSHPNGFTAATQMNSASHAQAGSQAKWWTHGNGQGSEKWDGFEEAARFSNSQDEFDKKVQLQANFVPAVNHEDSEPSAHPMGFSFMQKEIPTQDNLVQRDETNYERFWMNLDAANSKDEKEFNQKAAKVKLPSFNENDTVPPKE